MKLNPLLAISAILYGGGALLLVFAPAEVLSALATSPAQGSAWLTQLLGAALFGFAWLNWSQRFATVGGILGRPLLLANLGFTLTSGLITIGLLRHTPSPAFIAAGPVFAVLATCFITLLLKRTPGS